MDIKDCAKFANEFYNCQVATGEGDQPRVRTLHMWFADKTGFYFQTQTVKEVFKQVKNNPKVELYFRDPEGDPGHDTGKVLRVTGKAKIIEDMKFKEKAIKERDILKVLGITKPGDPLLGLFQVYTGEAYFWTIKDSMRESQIPRIKF